MKTVSPDSVFTYLGGATESVVLVRAGGHPSVLRRPADGSAVDRAMGPPCRRTAKGRRRRPLPAGAPLPVYVARASARARDSTARSSPPGRLGAWRRWLPRGLDPNAGDKAAAGLQRDPGIGVHRRAARCLGTTSTRPRCVVGLALVAGDAANPPLRNPAPGRDHRPHAPRGVFMLTRRNPFLGDPALYRSTPARDEAHHQGRREVSSPRRRRGACGCSRRRPPRSSPGAATRRRPGSAQRATQSAGRGGATILASPARGRGDRSLWTRPRRHRELTSGSCPA